MSKQSKAKEDQGYTPKANPQTCGNCAHYKSDFVKSKSEWNSSEWVQEKNISCGIGGFAVKKMGTCNLWVGKTS